MKRVFAIILILIIFISGLGVFSVFADEESAPELFFAADFLEEFVTQYPNRYCGTKGEENAAQFLSDEFKKIGYTPFNSDGSYLQNFSFTSSGKPYNSQNVIMTKESLNDSKKTVIIGAHYDNAYSLPEGKNEDEYKFQGAYDNGTGVAVLMDLAYKLKNVELDFNIVFIAFGGEELLAKGSEHYASSLSKEEAQNILIMFNLDVIGAGDKLYLYCDEVDTLHEKFLLQTADDLAVSVNLPPIDKHIEVNEVGDMPYKHIGFLSDNLPFLTRGINCAFFFTYNWEHGLSESSNNSTIIHKETDNMETLESLYKDTYKNFMTNVSDIIFAAVSESDFEKTMILSFENKFEYRIFFNKFLVWGVAFGVLLGLGVLVYFTYRKMDKQNLPEIIEGDPFNKSDGPFSGDDADNSVFGREFEKK